LIRGGEELIADWRRSHDIRDGFCIVTVPEPGALERLLVCRRALSVVDRAIGQEQVTFSGALAFSSNLAVRLRLLESFFQRPRAGFIKGGRRGRQDEERLLPALLASEVVGPCQGRLDGLTGLFFSLSPGRLAVQLLLSQPKAGPGSCADHDENGRKQQ